MDDRIKAFLDRLEQELSNLPSGEKDKALGYYREYINDALEEGADAGELLARLESPERIASAIKAEASIKKAQKDPGLKNYSIAAKYVRLGITRPLSVLLLSILIFLTYCVAVSFYIAAACAAACSLAALSYLLYEAFNIPSMYAAEIIGTAGMGIFAAGICMLAAGVLFAAGRLFIRLSAGLLPFMLNKTAGRAEDAGSGKNRKRGTRTVMLKAGPAAIVIGSVLALASGLPVKMFMIFNSMKPANIVAREWKYSPDGLGVVRIATAHSAIRLEFVESDEITLRYEQSDWLEPVVECADGRLAFTEKSNGRMPAFSLVSMHENSAELAVLLPDSFKSGSIGLESRGGVIYLNPDGFAGEIAIKTYTGSIFISSPSGGGIPASVNAGTARGSIYLDRLNVGQRIPGGAAFHIGAGAAAEGTAAGKPVRRVFMLDRP